VARTKDGKQAEAKRRARIGRQVSDIVNEVVLATADDDVEAAIDTLHARLQRVSGATFDRSWAERAVKTMRRGEVFKPIIRLS
jgi:hypothetical protein